MGGTGAAILAAHRADMHHAAAGPFGQQRQKYLGADKRPLEVGRKDQVPIRVRDEIEIGGFVDAGIVDEDRNAAQSAACGLGSACDACAVGNIHPQCDGPPAHRDDLCLRCLRLVAALAIGERHIGAGFCQSEGDSAPDAAAAAGDEGGLSGEGKARRQGFSCAQ